MLFFFPGPMSAIPPYIQPEINDYSDDSSHTSYSVKISNTCVMTDSSRYLGNSLSNRNHESSQEMHDKDDVIYGNFFSMLQNRQRYCAIQNMHLSNSTLEGGVNK